MLSRLFTERERPVVRVLRTTRALVVVTLASVTALVLLQADPDHRLAGALLGAAWNWTHAAFPTLIK